MERGQGKAEECWGDDTIYCEATCAPEDVLYEGSDDEDYDSPTSRRLRYESAGQKFLDGQIPSLLTASLKGPFDEKSGWVNPWRSKHRTSEASRGATQSLGKFTRKSDRERDTSITETQFEQHDSLECHLPSPESIKHAPIAEPHPFLEHEELAMVQRWRKSVYPISTEGFWATTPQGSKSERKRKAAGSEWLRKLAGKRRRAEVVGSGFVDTPVPKHSGSLPDSSSFGFDTSFNSDPDGLSSTRNVHTLHRREIANFSHTTRNDGEDELHDSNNASFATAPSRLQSSGKRISPKKDLKRRAIYELAKDSEDELSRDEIDAIKAAATLSSPVSQQRCSQTLPRKSPRHTMSQQAAERQLNLVHSSMQRSVASDMEAVNNFQTQQDESFCFKMRSKPSKEMGHQSEHSKGCDITETESWSGLSESSETESEAASLPEAEPIKSSELSNQKLNSPVTVKRTVKSSDLSDENIKPSTKFDEGSLSSSLSSLASDNVEVPNFPIRESPIVERTINSDVLIPQSESNKSHKASTIGGVTEIENALEVQGVMEQNPTIVADEDSGFEKADETQTTMEWDSTMGIEDEGVRTKPEVSIEELSDISTKVEMLLSHEVVPKDGDTASEASSESIASGNLTRDNDLVSEPEIKSGGETEFIPAQIRQSIPQAEFARESDSQSVSKPDRCDIENFSSHTSEPWVHKSTPIKTSLLSETLPLSLLKSSVKRLVTKAPWAGVSYLAHQTNSSPPRKVPQWDGFSHNVLNETPQNSESERPAAEHVVGAYKSLEQISDATSKPSSFIQSSPPNNRVSIITQSSGPVQAKAMEVTPTGQQVDFVSQRISASQQSPWAGSKLSQYVSVGLGQQSLDTPQKMDESLPVSSEAQTPWAREHVKLLVVPLDSTFLTSVESTDQTSAKHERTPLGQLHNNAMSIPPVATPTANARPSTPEPQFSFKSFASFMSPSPERLPLNRRAARQNSVTQLPSTQGILASATKNPWNGDASHRHVSWAPLPCEISSPASSEMLSPIEPRQRAISPPPSTSIAELPTSKDAKFHHHFTAVARRTSSKDSRNRILPTASQRSLASPAPQAMAEAFLAADQLHQLSSTYKSPDDRNMGLLEPREPIDIVEDIMREMGEILGTWDVDTELDLARKGGSMQMSQLTKSQ